MDWSDYLYNDNSEPASESNRQFFPMQYQPTRYGTCSNGATCTTELLCLQAGGRLLSYCSLYYYPGVCCIREGRKFSHVVVCTLIEQQDCGRTSSEDVDLFRNPNYPNNDVGANNCVFTLVTRDTTCGVRIDFLQSVLANPVDNDCYQDVVIILNTDKRFQGFNTPFCGLLQGYSTVLMVGGLAEIKVVVTTQNKKGSLWNIRLTQLRCGLASVPEEEACGIRNRNSAAENPDFPAESKITNDRFLENSASYIVSTYDRSSWDSNMANQSNASTTIDNETSLGRTGNFTMYDTLPLAKLFLERGYVARDALLGEAQEDDLFKILGGTEAAPHQFPWLVVLLLDGSLHCGGSLISKQWVLTAAHCVVITAIDTPAITRFLVVLGVHNISSASEPRRMTRFLLNIVRHPQYQGGENDIALVKLNEDVKYTSAIRPVCLPRNSDKTFSMADGIIAGWGSTGNVSASSVLLIAPIPILNNSYCASVWGRVGVEIQESMICAGLTGTSTCLGDSGGPLVVEDEDGLYTIVGVTSFGAPPSCGSLVYPDVWTRVSSYINWITQTLVNTVQ
uniref:limulus clotting factor C n=1 Tax=Timema poppense TaxID=170557 RepID=A0A7R9CX28_TIMPO|nr:unnamed protein product [Timema poppensis]